MTALKTGDLAFDTFTSDPNLSVPTSGYGDQTYRVRFRQSNNGTLKISQKVTLPPGTYTFSANVTGLNQMKIYVFADDNKDEEQSLGAGTWRDKSVSFTLNATKEVELGINFTHNSDAKATAGLDNCKLTYTALTDEQLKSNYETALTAANNALGNGDYENVTGSEREDLTSAIVDYAGVISDYQTAIDVLESATNTFTAAKASYDAYVTYVNSEQKATDDEALSALGATFPSTPNTAAEAAEYEHNVNVAEYNAVKDNYTTAIELGTWTEGGTNTKPTTFSNEHWSGTTSGYKNQDDSNSQGWNASSWSMYTTQDLTLPEGEYVFKVAARRSDGATVTLTVKNGDNILGTVNNFPVGNTGLGITTDGVASFDANSTYANSNKGYGWQWRFVPFTVPTGGATITIGVDASASTSCQWVSYGDYTVQSKPSAEASKIAYTQAYTAAQAALANTDYANVTGSEKSTLEAFAENPTGTTASAIDTETENLKAATTAFTDAKASYDEFVTVKAAIDQNLSLEYASTDAKTAFDDAKNATASSASDAKAKTAVIRAYYESNAKAEIVTDKTEVTINGKVSEDATIDKTIPDGWTLDKTRVNGSDGYTASDATTPTTRYFDSNGTFWGSSSSTASVKQSVTLEGGKYILSVMSRSSSSPLLSEYKLYAGDNAQTLPTGDNAKGIFGNGWDCTYLVFTAPAGDIEIGVSGTTNTNGAWFSCDNFQLYKIADLETVTLDEAETSVVAATTDYVNVNLGRKFTVGWNSVVLPFATTAEALGADEAAKYTGTDGNTIKFETTTTLEANTPYLVYFTDAQTEAKVINGVKIEPTTEPKVEDSQYDFVGTYTANPTISKGDYIVVSGGIQKAAGGNALKAFRAYFKANTTESAAKSMVISIDGNAVSTGINGVSAESVSDGNVYNVAGQKVSGSYKGLVIKNGKKYLRK